MKTTSIIIIVTLVQAAISAYNWTETENIIQHAINEGLFSGCVLGISTNNATLLEKAFGTVGPKRGFYSPPVKTDMKFDLGSLTTPIVLNAGLMDFFDRGLVLPTNRASNFLSDFDNNGKRFITVQNLLEHNSGISSII